MVKKIYIAGKITGDPWYKGKFKEIEDGLIEQGHIVLNPVELPEGMGYEDYMEICFAMIRQADEVYFLPDWKDSSGATREMHFAKAYKKKIKDLR